MECVRPNCGEEFDPEQTGGSCPNCQTPHPDVDFSGGEGGDDESEESKPEVECPDPDCSGSIAEGGDYCPKCGTERGAEVETDDSDEAPTCPNGHEVGPDVKFCSQCGEPVSDNSETEEDEGPPTCPNGHEVDADAQFCPKCGEAVSDEGGGNSDTSEGPSVTLEIGSHSYDVIEDGEITVDDDEKSPDVFGTDARRAAQAEGVDAGTARQIHRDYLSFRVDGDDCYVTNKGQNPTKYNDDEFQQDEEEQLEDGDKIELGAGAITAVVTKDD